MQRMLLDQVPFQIVTQAEGLRADVAGVTFVARVNQLVPVQVRLARELRVADRTGVGRGRDEGAGSGRASRPVPGQCGCSPDGGEDG